MEILLLTNEYPPHVYGGAGVHVDFLSRELANLEEGRHALQIVCFGDQQLQMANLKVKGVRLPSQDVLKPLRHEKLVETLFRNVMMVGSVEKADVVHCHTWYSLLAGCLIKQCFGIPLVITTHSLEPQRPWKEEQLGAAYAASSWLERTAYENADGVIAVSESMKTAVQSLYGVPREKVRAIPNGIDARQYKPTEDPELLRSYRIDPDRPILLFVGRISRQKGILHVVDAVKYLPSDLQVVLCAGAPDTEDIGREMEARVEKARVESPPTIVWIRQWLPREHLIRFYSHASLFVCPSIYEPFGIINLEAMACGTPVVASAVGGIPEVVDHGQTGWLVPFEPIDENIPEPKDPERFSRDLADAVKMLLLLPEKRKMMGLRARSRVEEHFSWQSVARRTLDFYEALAT